MTPARRATILTGAAFLFLAAVFGIAQVRDLARPPHLDETEHLHAAIRIAAGERIYVDFFEHHPPLFVTVLSLLAPGSGDPNDIPAYVARARLLAGACAAIALLSAASIVYRASGRPYAPLVYLSLMLAAANIWRNGIGDIRPDSMALAFWWGGAALVLLPRNEWLRGLGLGLVFVASVVAPKWPVQSVVIGVIFLARPALRAIAAAILTAAAAIAVTASLADLGTVWFHVMTFTRAIWHGMVPAATSSALLRCPQLLRPQVIAAALLILLAARWRHREAFRMPRFIELFALLAVASLIEMRFLYYPNTDFRFWVSWSFSAAALLALTPQGLQAFLPKARPAPRRIAAAVPVVLTLIALALAVEHVGPQRSLNESYWRYSRWIVARLGPNDTVWLRPERHPIGARDASHHWFGFGDVIPTAVRLGLVRESDLPPCRLDPNVRFLSEPGTKLPVVRACLDELRRAGRIERTPVPEIWMVR